MQATYFLYAGDFLIGEYQNGVMIQRYVHSGGIDKPLVSYSGSAVGPANRQFLHANYQGSIITATDNDGNLNYVNTYDAYGVPGRGNTGRFAYTGQMYLPGLGLYHYKARVYDPQLGRFLQTDPVGYEDQMNLYAYVHNDPLSFSDPSGMESVPFDEEVIVTGNRGGSRCGWCQQLTGDAARAFVQGMQNARNNLMSVAIWRTTGIKVGMVAAISNVFNENSEVEEEYDSLEDATGEVNELDDVEKEGKTENPGLRGQGYTEKWSGVNSSGEIVTAFKNPKTGKWTGGHRSSQNDKYW